ncbi:MAG TPA: hypothetical protein VHC69_34450 [Polyangiaceae bacterium]|nr:hypothetical protein [Polyangiaceae bacterium]
MSRGPCLGRLRSVRPGPVFGFLAAVALVASSLAGCDHHDCYGPYCRCYPGYGCVQNCGPGPCELDCASFDAVCQSTCANDCVIGCNDGPTCRNSCGDRCNVACDHVSSCTTTCGASCQYACTSVSSCVPRVGDASEVFCESVGSCDVTCDGSCRVHCQNTGSCTVFCPQGTDRTQCSDGFACGESC